MKNLKLFDLSRRHKSSLPRYHQNLVRLIGSSDFILGEGVDEFEENCRDYLDVQYFASTASCTASLYLSLKALGIGRGDEVLVTPMSYLASVSVISLAGATAKFVDVDDSLNISSELIERHITRRTKAILVVHLGGIPADIISICKIAREHNLYVVEDCAQSFGGKLEGKSLGSFGDIGCYSFHPLKILPALGDAGGVTARDPSIMSYIQKARNHGHNSRDDVDFFSHNFRLDSFKAICLSFLLNSLDSEILHRQRLREFYAQKLEPLFPRVTFPRVRANSFLSLNFIMIMCDEREALMGHLSKNNIEVKIHYPLLLSGLSPLRGRYLSSSRSLPKSVNSVSKILTIPFGSHISMNDASFIVGAIKDFYTRV